MPTRTTGSRRTERHAHEDDRCGERTLRHGLVERGDDSVGVVGRVVPAVGATVAVTVAGKVDRQGLPIEREQHGVPRMGVLRAAVEEHELAGCCTPAQRTQDAPVVEHEPATGNDETRRPFDAVLGAVLVEVRELVVDESVVIGTGSGLIRSRHRRIVAVRRGSNLAAAPSP